MAEFKRVLFAVDLASLSARAMACALTLARQFSSELHLLYVVREFEAFDGVDLNPSLQYGASLAKISALAQTKLDEIVAKDLGGYQPVKTALAHGQTAREILKYVETHDISLVVMGTHGHAGLNRILFGSVAQRVVQCSPVPVLTVRPDPEG